MPSNDNVRNETQATREAQDMWHSFVVGFKICGTTAAVALVLMAIFLV